MIKKLLLISLILTSCKNINQQETINKISKIQISPEQVNFGTVKIYDTIFQIFKVKNISSNPLTIDSIGTSCGCTTLKYSKSKILENGEVDITIQFVPEQFGFTKNSIVIDANTDPPFSIVYLKGNVIE